MMRVKRRLQAAAKYRRTERISKNKKPAFNSLVSLTGSFLAHAPLAMLQQFSTRSAA
jgi:hypothetical protein